MMHFHTKRIVSLLLAVLTIASLLTVPAAAASNTNWPNDISKSSYVEMKAPSKVLCFQNAQLSTRGTCEPRKAYNSYIDAGDLLYIYEINNTYTVCSFPTSSGRRTAYVSTASLFGVSAPVETATATAKVKTYSNAGATASSGSVFKNESVWKLSTSGSGSTILILYPADNGNRGYKAAFIRYNDYTSYFSTQKAGASSSGSAVTTTSVNSWDYPMTSTYVCGNDWSEYYAPRASKGRPDHCGIDIASRTGSTAVYAAAGGEVVATGNNSANGKFVILKHSLSGKNIYSFYCHLSSYQNLAGFVPKGTHIGTMGNSGSSSAGSHVHFAIMDKLNATGGYVGYTASFSDSANKVTYNGTTFYNPHFVVQYDKVP